MDIDFHYHATYLAARYAGYTRAEAQIIGSSAQMIDENGRDAVADKITVTLPGSKDVACVFTPKESFTGIGSTFADGTFRHSQDKTASIWSAYHFLPGNFDMPHGVPDKFVSPRWTRREFRGGTEAVPPLFKWLCRPHSPMAVHLIKNCRELVHGNSVVKREGIEPYMIGVTMHVFVDTWAHQDFTGPPEKKVNNAGKSTFYAFYPQGRGVRFWPPVFDPSRLKFRPASWKFLKDAAPPAGGAAYTGHGRMGHWPDHSALVWKYQPAWIPSGEFLLRDNPAMYYDCFLHMVAALVAIRTNTEYKPFELTSENLLALFDKTTGDGRVPLTKERMSHVNVLLQRERAALPHENNWFAGKIDDTWDQAVAAHSELWSAAMPRELGLPNGEQTETWYPGKSDWIALAKKAVGKDKRIDARQLRSLDFFKFNTAAKLHYRTVKEQLLGWKQQLIGEWSDGSAYVEDYAALQLDREAWREKARAVLTKCVSTTLKQYRQQGLMLLLQEVDEVRTEQDLVARLQLAISDPGEEVYTMRYRDGGNSIKKITTLIKELGGSGTPATALATLGHLPSLKEWKEKSSVALSIRSRDVLLTTIDQKLSFYHFATTELARYGELLLLSECIAAWLENNPAPKANATRRKAVLDLQTAVALLLKDEESQAA